MKWNKLYEYPKSMRSLINEARHYDSGRGEATFGNHDSSSYTERREASVS
jgi:hypothetical protein